MRSSCARRRRPLRSRSRKQERVTKGNFNSSAEPIERRDVYERVTARIVADLEKGVRPWVKPWAGPSDGRFIRPQRHNGLPYSGVNVLMLWSVALERGYGSPTWMTFKQAVELNANVRKGEKGSLVVYANRLTRMEQTDAGEEFEREISFLKGYTVFNTEQIDGLPPAYYSDPLPRYTNPVHRIEHAEKFFASTGADIRERGGRAFYTQDSDYIQIPPIEAFPEWEEFYSTLAHEATHWTKHPRRLDRDFGRKNWGDEGYAVEELVAELGAAFLCADLEITADVREDHAAYIDSWLKVLNNDKRAIFSAASHAQRAADYLHNLQPEFAPRPPHELVR